MNDEYEKALLLEVASKSIGSIPTSYFELNHLVWRIFELGRQYGEAKPRLEKLGEK
jgi:hypothetical protein